MNLSNRIRALMSKIEIEPLTVIFPLRKNANQQSGNLSFTLSNPVAFNQGGLYLNGEDEVATLANVPFELGGRSSSPFYIRLTASVDLRGNSTSSIFSASNGTTERFALTRTNGVNGMVQFKTPNTTINLNRPKWAFKGKFPLTTENGIKALPQAILFLSSTEMLITAHYNDNYTTYYKIDVASGAVLGSFKSVDGLHHVSSLSLKSDGSVWGVDYLTATAIEIDLTASLSSGFCVVSKKVKFTAYSGIGNGEWVNTTNGEFFLIGRYLSSATGYHLYLIPASELVDGLDVSATAYLKRWTVGSRIQGIRFYNGKLYVASNTGTADTSTTGYISEYEWTPDTATNTTLSPVRQFPAPSSYPEDIDFHPTTGEMWTQTEGLNSTGDYDYFLSRWSCNMDEISASNTYEVYYKSGVCHVNINNYHFHSFNTTANGSITTLSLGNSPNGSSYTPCIVRDLVVSNQDNRGVSFDFGVSLTPVNMSIVNGDAESPIGSEWIVQTGVLGRRDSLPLPANGRYYFYDPSSAAHYSYQVVDLSQNAVDIDSGLMSANLKWNQASWSSGADKSTCGVRFFDGSGVLLSEKLPPEITPVVAYTWFARGLNTTIPVGTRLAHVVIKMTRAAGTALDGYTDNIKLDLYKQNQ